jgi:RNA polymerase sigma-70 factor, ECF subfamily
MLFETRFMQTDFLELYDRIKHRISNYCRMKTGNEADAHDLLADTIEASYHSFASLRDRQAFLAFMISTANHIYSNQQKRHARSRLWNPKIEQILPDTYSQPDVSTDVSLLYDYLKKLPPVQQEAVSMFYVLDMSLEEISQVQGVTLSAVKSRVTRGREKLLEIMKEPQKDKKVRAAGLLIPITLGTEPENLAQEMQLAKLFAACKTAQPLIEISEAGSILQNGANVSSVSPRFSGLRIMIQQFVAPVFLVPVLILFFSFVPANKALHVVPKQELRPEIVSRPVPDKDTLSIKDFQVFARKETLIDSGKPVKWWKRKQKAENQPIVKSEIIFPLHLSREEFARLGIQITDSNIRYCNQSPDGYLHYVEKVITGKNENFAWRHSENPMPTKKDKAANDDFFPVFSMKKWLKNLHDTYFLAMPIENQVEPKNLLPVYIRYPGAKRDEILWFLPTTAFFDRLPDRYKNCGTRFLEFEFIKLERRKSEYQKYLADKSTFKPVN